MKGWWQIGGVMMLAAAAPALAADELEQLSDGYHTWAVEGTSDVRSCCFSWRNSKASGSGCKLDGSSVSVATSGDCASGPGGAQVYVRVVNGATADVWVFSTNCPVASEDEIQDHGVVSADRSVDWFRSQIESRKVNQDVREEALFALVQTESDAAFRYLDGLLN